MLQKCYKNATGGIFWVSGEFGKDSFSCDGWWGKSGVDLVLIFNEPPNSLKGALLIVISLALVVWFCRSFESGG